MAKSRWEYHRKRRREKKEWLDQIKRERGCLTCGENDPECLDFHHIDASTKTYEVSRLYAGTWSRERILQEIELCILQCCNCHRKIHGRARAGRLSDVEP